MNTCIFCSIAAGNIPAHTIYETDSLIAFLDINPNAKGHTLVIPKAHYEWMKDTPDALVSELFLESKKIMHAMIKGLGCDYVRLNVVGTDVPHFHIHLIPLMLGQERLGHERYGDGEQEIYTEKIKHAL